MPSTTRPPFRSQLYHKTTEYVIISLWQERLNCDLFPNRIAIITTNIAIRGSILVLRTVVRISPQRGLIFIPHLYIHSSHHPNRQSPTAIFLISPQSHLPLAHKMMAHTVVLPNSPSSRHPPKPALPSLDQMRP